MAKYEIKYKDNHGNWQHIPGLSGTFESENDAIDYINKEILGGVWGKEWETLDPDDIEVFEIEE